LHRLSSEIEYIQVCMRVLVCVYADIALKFD
jgi:hypothetical protein